MTTSDSQIELTEDQIPKVTVRWRHVIWQLVATCVAQSIVMQTGVNLLYSAILLPQLRNSTTSDIVINNEEASWIASLLTLFSPLGSFTIGPLMEKIGPKSICLLSSIPFIFSWGLFAFSKEVYHLYIARSLIGFGEGLSNVALVYVSEISHPVFRPTLLGLNSAFVSFGILLTAVLGLLVTWRTMAIICGVLVVISSAGMLFMPESPYWLVAFHDNLLTTRVEKSLHWLHPKKEIYDEQLQEVLKSKRNRPQNEENKSIWKKIKVQLEIMKDPTVYKPTIILLILFLFQQLSGAYVTISYAVDVFTKIGGQFGNGIDEYVSLVFLGALRFIIAIISSLISKRISRRILLNVSCLGMTVCCVILSLYLLYFQSSSTDIIALISFLAYISFASLGMLVIPWSLLGELLPVRVKGKIGGPMITIVTLMMFACVKTFPSLMEACSIEIVFLILAVCNFLAACFIYWFVPETLGKTFAEIEEHFR